MPAAAGNHSVPHVASPVVIAATLTAQANGSAVDQRTLAFIVPPILTN